MNLEQSTQQALDFTRRLEAALHLGDLDLCAEILQMRGAVMEHFTRLHRSAPDREKAAVADLVKELAEADTRLQQETTRQLGATAAEFRANLNSGPARTTPRYGSGPTQACVDIKA